MSFFCRTFLFPWSQLPYNVWLTPFCLQDATVDPKGGGIRTQVFFAMWGGPVGVHRRGMPKGTSSLCDAVDVLREDGDASYEQDWVSVSALGFPPDHLSNEPYSLTGFHFTSATRVPLTTGSIFCTSSTRSASPRCLRKHTSHPLLSLRASFVYFPSLVVNTS